MSTATVLYIEDRPDNRMLVKRVLMIEDITVIEADNADLGIYLARQLIPDLILMDINMPGKDGYLATHDIRQIAELNHVPVVALTANAMKGDKERSLDAGCDGYISKPIDVDRFPNEVAAWIRRGRR